VNVTAVLDKDGYVAPDDNSGGVVDVSAHLDDVPAQLDEDGYVVLGDTSVGVETI
jgi:hypothetical protein